MNIGKFKLTSKGYDGTLNTLFYTDDITIEPNRKDDDKAPDFKVFHGAARARHRRGCQP